MRFRILRTEELPLGTRILRPGSKGADVKDLQELLNRNGFYFGKIDGKYGPLTEEAVRLLEQTFRFTIDGIAGRQVIAALKNPSRQTGRIIYTVKARENLKTISRKWGVNQNAWQGIPGRGNPKKRLYPGMRLLLHEKALFLWNSAMATSGSHSKSGFSKPERQLRNNIKVTKFIGPGWLVEPNGDLSRQETESASEPDAYQSVAASPEVWKALLTSKTLRSKLAARLRKLKSNQLGLDLRNAPLDAVFHWPNLLKNICHDNHGKIRFLILPLLPSPRGGYSKHPYAHNIQVYWLSLALISKFAQLLIFAPFFDTEDPLSYEASAAQLPQAILELSNQELNHKSILLLTPECWDWNLNLHVNQPCPYSKARMIRAVNQNAVKYSNQSKLTAIQYLSRHENHCLVYRDIQGFMELFSLINKTNLLGVALDNFEVLGKAGIEVILNSFTVLPEAKLQTL